MTLILPAAFTASFAATFLPTYLHRSATRTLMHLKSFAIPRIDTCTPNLAFCSEPDPVAHQKEKISGSANDCIWRYCFEHSITTEK